jgi:putative acetyltransferase
VAAAILERIIAGASARGLSRPSLETGVEPAFGPALRRDRRRGFVDGGAFGDYEQSPYNPFLRLILG